jgi:hypothetical protein
MLGALLSTPPRGRLALSYERMFDDFVERSGGERVNVRFNLPSHVKNPDYYFVLPDCELLLELKQISNYRPDDTVDAYFTNLRRLGKVLSAEQAGPMQWRIGPESLSPADWARFYLKFRPSVSKHLEKAARQLRETDALLPRQGNRPRFCGLLLINSGDYNLPLDLMFRLVDWRTKREWKSGKFSKLDFVSCLTVDLMRANQNPMQGRHIIRPEPPVGLPGTIRLIYEHWLHYYAEAIGACVEFHPEMKTVDPPLSLSGGYAGKICLATLDESSDSGSVKDKVGGDPIPTGPATR